MELFRNSHDALVFAFNFSSQQYGVSEMARLAGSAGGSGKGLIGMDGAAQAGLIMAEVGRMDALHRACIVGRYSMRFKECACCHNSTMPLSDYKEAITTLAQWSVSYISGLSIRQMREVIIRSFYESGISFKAEAERLKVPKSTAYDQRSLIFGGLKKLDSEAQGDIFPKIEKMCGFQ